jgi:hypothetical protein
MKWQLFCLLGHLRSWVDLDVSEEGAVSELTATDGSWVDGRKWLYAIGRLQGSWPIRTADRRRNETFAKPIQQVLKYKVRKQGHYTVLFWFSHGEKYEAVCDASRSWGTVIDGETEPYSCDTSEAVPSQQHYAVPFFEKSHIYVVTRWREVNNPENLILRSPGCCVWPAGKSLMKHDGPKAPGVIHVLLCLKYPLKKTKEISNGYGRQIYTTFPVWEDNERLVKDVFQDMPEVVYKKKKSF